MALNFEMKKVLKHKSPQNFLGEEPNLKLYHYFITKNSQESDCKTDIGKLADYGTGPDFKKKWSKPLRSFTSQRVKRIGVKTFPQIGGVGFYNYADRAGSVIVVPIHPKDDKKTSTPHIEASQGTDGTVTVTFTMSDNKEIPYGCCRIVLRQGKFAEEHVRYFANMAIRTDVLPEPGEYNPKTSAKVKQQIFTLPQPKYSGAYTVCAIGYKAEGEIPSNDSNYVELTLTGQGAETYDSLSDNSATGTSDKERE